MSCILVSIISEHLIPNYHLFQHLKQDIDGHLLITTAKMEALGNTNNFINQIEEDIVFVKKIVTEASSFERTLSKLKAELSTTSNNKFIVNLTGGTKMVSLAVFSFFQNLNSEIYYVAIGSNSCTQFYPVHKASEKFKHSLSLTEYLGLYGYQITYNNTLHKSIKFTENLFNEVKVKNYNALQHFKIRTALVDKKCDNMQDLKYYQGLWFEEYVFQLFKDKLNLADSQIALGVHVLKHKEKGLSDNEFDVMFIKNNRLYVVECKSSIGKKKEKGIKVEGFLYKLAAAVHNFGLQVYPVLAVMGEIHTSKKIVDRANILNIKTLDAQKFDNELLFDFYLTSL